MAYQLSVVFLIVICTGPCRNEIFNSFAHTRQFLLSVHKLPELIEAYIKIMQDRLNRLQEHSQKFVGTLRENLHLFNEENLSNPISAYLVIKFFLIQWESTESILRENITEAVLNSSIDLKTVHSVTPDIEDIIGLSKALLTLQTIYELETKSMADGILPGGLSSFRMTASDCLDLGLAAYRDELCYHAMLWMREALERTKREKINLPITDKKIQEYVAQCFDQLNKTQAETSIKPEPENKGAPILDVAPEMSKNVTKFGHLNNPHVKKISHYGPLCRGEISRAENSRLYCYYKNDKPFLKLAPVKVEFLNLAPEMRLFRGVVAQHEIDVLTDLANPSLSRSLVFGRHVSDSRTSTQTWFFDDEHFIVESLSRRVADMTNLDIKSAEPFQIADYGIGGYYFPHLDVLYSERHNLTETDKFRRKAIGDRMATVLFYLAEPKAGGATVFPRLNVTILPTKYDAIFWYNFNASGKEDDRMIHSGCPVIIGSKWILNKWLHEREQEFRRPCTLNEFE